MTLLGLSLPLCGFGQTYQVESVPLSGYLELFLTDWGNSPGSSVTFGTYGGQTTSLSLTETVYIDPMAQTVRQVGFLSMGYDLETSANVQKTINGSPMSASVDVRQWSGYGGGPLQFDTGPRPYSWDSSSQSFTFDGHLDCSGTVNGTYSLITGGQTLAGPFSYGLSGTIEGYSQFSPETTFTFLGESTTYRTLAGWSTSEGEFNGTGGVSTGADNGFELALRPGLNDGLNLFNAGAQPQWATLVPELGSLALMGIGLTGLTACRRRRSAKQG